MNGDLEHTHIQQQQQKKTIVSECTDTENVVFPLFDSTT